MTSTLFKPALHTLGSNSPTASPARDSMLPFKIGRMAEFVDLLSLSNKKRLEIK